MNRNGPSKPGVVELDELAVGEAVAVLADAFHDYPVMRFVLGPGGDYDSRLHALVGLFVRARFARQGPVLGLHGADGVLVGVATMTLPRERAASVSFGDWREHLWRMLGGESRARYEAFSAAANGLEPTLVHHHLNMIGVRRDLQGRGHARALLDAVHELAAIDPGSAGVSLSTEHAPNVALYERFGYSVAGYARVTPELETWVMFRPSGG